MLFAWGLPHATANACSPRDWLNVTVRLTTKRTTKPATGTLRTPR
jgi:hypothetical protein